MSFVIYKIATRNRPHHFLCMLDSFFKNIVTPDPETGSEPKDWLLLISADKNDMQTYNQKVLHVVKYYMAKFPGKVKIFFGESSCKVEAVNRDIEKITEYWQTIVVLTDFIRIVDKEFHLKLRGYMHMDFCILKNDIDNEITVTVLGKDLYKKHGKVVYDNRFKNKFCKLELLNFSKKLGSTITEISNMIKLNHPKYGYLEPDSLMIEQQKTWAEDLMALENIFSI